MGVKDKVHEFQLATPQGVGTMRVPHADMKCCPCGCDRWNMQYHVTFGKPNGILGAPEMCLRVEIYVCADCGGEMQPTHPTVGQFQAGKTKSQVIT